MDSGPAAVPPTLLLALSSPTRRSKSIPSLSTLEPPIASSTYLVSLSSGDNSPAPYTPSNSDWNRDSAMLSEAMTIPPSPPQGAGAALRTDSSLDEPAHRRTSQNYSDDSGRQHELDDIRSSSDGGQRRDSTTKSSGGGGRLGTVNENTRELLGGERRESRTSTFGPSGGDGLRTDPNSPEPSLNVSSRRPSPSFRDELTPGRFSVANSDALRRQSLRSSQRPSREEGERPPLSASPSEKPELTRDSEDDRDPRPVSGSYRLTLKTTNESTNGYTGYGSSNGHSEYKKGQHPHIPRSSYYVGPPADGSAFGTEPMGEIGVHFPREIVRIERDYSGGELVQFYPTYPLEFEGRITPTKFQASINEINEVLISAYSLKWSALENALSVLTLYVSTLLIETHHEKEMKRLARLFDKLNAELYNPAGLNLLWPRKVGFLFLEIEYY